MTTTLSHEPAAEMAFVPVLRVARPCRSLSATAGFYTRALGLEVLETFTDHAGFDGVILGRPGWPYHLELTHQAEHSITPRPTAEDLLVIYLPDRAEWHAAIQQIRDTGARPVPSRNPYWDRCGQTFEDPDGYRIVIANISWP
jgi:catechol 2,3-dioxygenase-like lactoylglutathione lyase family enzyme